MLGEIVGSKLHELVPEARGSQEVVFMHPRANSYAQQATLYISYHMTRVLINN